MPVKCFADEKILYKTLLLLSIFTQAITPVSIFVSATASHCYSWERRSSWWHRWRCATDRAVAKYNLSIRCFNFYQSTERHHYFEKPDPIARFSCVSFIHSLFLQSLLFAHHESDREEATGKRMRRWREYNIVDCPSFRTLMILFCYLNFILHW